MKKKWYVVFWTCASVFACAGMYQTERFLLDKAKNAGSKIIRSAGAWVEQSRLMAVAVGTGDELAEKAIKKV